jgi:N-acetylglutamate synthase-like GNAT family acetyltransferase
MIIKQIALADTLVIRQTVLWPNRPIEFIKIKGDENALHFGLYVNIKLTSVISCFENNGEIQFRKFATLTDMQNQGFGTCLLNYTINEARRRGIKRIWCNARLSKMGFYQKLGLTATDNKFFKDGIEYITMELKFD